jgi:hypothetical protein
MDTVASKASPTASDKLLINDEAASGALRVVTIGNLPGASGTDTNAVHVNTGTEFVGITEKTTPVSADLLIIEDSAASNAKKRLQIGNLPSSGSDVTTKGDLQGYSTVPARIPVGTDGQLLESRASESLGVQWVDAPTGTVPSGTADQDRLLWDDTASAWKAISEGNVFNVMAEPYNADNTGATDASTAIQSALDDADPDLQGGLEHGGVVIVPDGWYRLDTGLLIRKKVWLVAESALASWGMSGNTGSSGNLPTSDMMSRVMFVSKSAIHMLSAQHSTGGATNNWGGGGVVGIGFSDYSTNRDTVLSGVRVVNLQHFGIIGCSFNDIRNTSGRAVYFNPSMAAAGQYSYMEKCLVQNAHVAVEFSANCPDVEIRFCHMYGNDSGGAPASGSVGIKMKTNSCRVLYGSVQFFDTHIDIVSDAASTGKQNKVFGTAMEVDGSDAFTSYVTVRNSGGTANNNQIVMCDFANISGGTDIIKVDSSVENTLIRDCYHPGSGGVLTTDNGIRTQYEGDLENSVTALTATTTLTGIHRIVRCTANSFTLNLPAAANAEGRVYHIANTGTGTITLDPNASELIDNASTITVTTNTSKTIWSDGTEWWSG